MTNEANFLDHRVVDELYTLADEIIITLRMITVVMSDMADDVTWHGDRPYHVCACDRGNRW